MKPKEPNWKFLDPGIREAVRLLNKFGIETFESCQGGKGHAYPEPTIRFHGERSEGFKALSMLVASLKNRSYVSLPGDRVVPRFD